MPVCGRSGFFALRAVNGDSCCDILFQKRRSDKHLVLVVSRSFFYSIFAPAAFYYISENDVPCFSICEAAKYRVSFL